MTTPNERLNGFFRAKVVENKDPNFFGRVLVWVPAIMPEIPQDQGLWARPANNHSGGRNMDLPDSNYMGSSFIPKKGSWVAIIFDDGNINKPYYTFALDIENTKVLPENQLGSNYEHKWTIFKSHEGRTIHISDDPDDCRVEITGKKRQITVDEDASGDTQSVYPVLFNQNTILLDERIGKEKILIQTYKGDFIHIDIDSRKLQCKFESDILIESAGSIHITAKDNIRMEAGDEMYQESIKGPTYRKSGMNIHDEAEAAYHMKSKKLTNIESTSNNINIKASKVINQEAGTDFNIKAGTIMNIESGAAFNIKSGAVLNAQSSGILNINSGAILNLMSAAITNITAGAALQASGLAVNILAVGPVAITGATGGMSSGPAGMQMESSGLISLKAVGPISLDGALTNEQCGLATPAVPATPSGSADSADSADSAVEATQSQPATPEKPVGGRDI